ncbi:hypothetical protein TNIN_202191 [Trichonephila inaurata madagascariensis]|uniref:Uncharacterized protein n=1 Tax=Trichonephila inaurata madagascariensis TaxID=2747483 RepID=A0A8X7C1S2_9ARAC|nr:hypothetical protein TNIN_202191 [Trichonephila inaurata madagascariensis]
MYRGRYHPEFQTGNDHVATPSNLSQDAGTYTEAPPILLTFCEPFQVVVLPCYLELGRAKGVLGHSCWAGWWFSGYLVGTCVNITLI